MIVPTVIQVEASTPIVNALLEGKAWALFSFPILLVVSTVYSVITLVGVWRSAANYAGLVLWKYATRFVLVLRAVSFVDLVNFIPLIESMYS